MLETMDMDREDVVVVRNAVKERRASLALEARLFRDVAETAQSGSAPAGAGHGRFNVTSTRVSSKQSPRGGHGTRRVRPER